VSLAAEDGGGGGGGGWGRATEQNEIGGVPKVKTKSNTAETNKSRHDFLDSIKRKKKKTTSGGGRRKELKDRGDWKHQKGAYFHDKQTRTISLMEKKVGGG